MKFPRLKKDLKSYIRAVEKYHLERALIKSEHSRAGAARLLGINRTTLLEKMKAYNLVDAFPIKQKLIEIKE